MDELKAVRTETKTKIGKLKLATDLHIGLEILHLFVLDVMGRDSAASKIFTTKSREDFRHSMVVTKFAKGLAWLLVIMLNFFFVYFSMLRGLQRGGRWQMVYLGACITQVLIEIVIYET